MDFQQDFMSRKRPAAAENREKLQVPIIIIFLFFFFVLFCCSCWLESDECVRGSGWKNGWMDGWIDKRELQHTHEGLSLFVCAVVVVVARPGGVDRAVPRLAALRCG